MPKFLANWPPILLWMWNTYITAHNAEVSQSFTILGEKFLLDRMYIEGSERFATKQCVISLFFVIRKFSFTD